MNIYLVGFLILMIIILFWRIRAGFKKGLSHEIDSAVSIAVAIIVVRILAKSISAFMSQRYGTALYVFLMLGLVFAVYRLLRLLLMSIKLFAHLPVIKGVDKILGIAAGLVEGFAIIFFLVFLTKSWLGM